MKKSWSGLILAVGISVCIINFPCFLNDNDMETSVNTADITENTDDFAEFHPVRRRHEIHTFDENDEYVLLQIAMAEAGDQDVEGKALVMNVVMNRIRDEEFPGTVEEVVMQPGQFEPVENGSFYEVTPDWGCVEALEMVAAGWDRSRGATYFEESYEGSWQSANLRKLFVHGCHTFYSNS